MNMDKRTRETSQDTSPTGVKSGVPLANINAVKYGLYQAKTNDHVQFYGGR